MTPAPEELRAVRAEPTPTPWKVANEIVVQDRNGLMVADTGARIAGALTEPAANAAFIVRAVNAHEALKNAAQLALETSDHSHVRGALREALLLAEVTPNV